MEILDQPSWHWGLSLIALTLAFHATAVVMLGIVAVSIRVRLQNRSLHLWKLVPVRLMKSSQNMDQSISATRPMSNTQNCNYGICAPLL